MSPRGGAAAISVSKRANATCFHPRRVDVPARQLSRNLNACAFHIPGPVNGPGYPGPVLNNGPGGAPQAQDFAQKQLGLGRRAWGRFLEIFGDHDSSLLT